MLLEFIKYHGAGNDFIVFDGRGKSFFSTGETLTTFFKKICHRNFGIGADGVIVVHKGKDTPLSMKYYNSDGLEGSMCGNGGRCFVAYANDIKLASNHILFDAIDGVHEAKVINCDDGVYDISLKIGDVEGITQLPEGVFIDTGSPHLIVFCKNISEKDVFNEGRELRYSKSFGPSGVNVNFVEFSGQNRIKIRTYERGVENETLACGTGAVAAAIATKIFKNSIDSNFFEVEALGGKLEVFFETENNKEFRNVWLRGPAQKVFEGKVLFKG